MVSLWQCLCSQWYQFPLEIASRSKLCFIVGLIKLQTANWNLIYPLVAWIISWHTAGMVEGLTGNNQSTSFLWKVPVARTLAWTSTIGTVAACHTGIWMPTARSTVHFFVIYFGAEYEKSCLRENYMAQEVSWWWTIHFGLHIAHAAIFQLFFFFLTHLREYNFVLIEINECVVCQTLFETASAIVSWNNQWGLPTDSVIGRWQPLESGSVLGFFPQGSFFCWCFLSPIAQSTLRHVWLWFSSVQIADSMPDFPNMPMLRTTLRLVPPPPLCPKSSIAKRELLQDSVFSGVRKVSFI